MDDLLEKNNHQTLIERAVAKHRGGKLIEAQNLYMEILAENKYHADANHNLGVLFASRNNMLDAVFHFETAVQTNPKIEQFWLSYLSALVKSGDVKRAIKAAISAKNYEFQSSKIAELIMEIDKLAVADNPPNLADQQLSTNITNLTASKSIRLAEKKITEGDTETAQKILQHLLQRYPGNRVARSALSKLKNNPDQTRKFNGNDARSAFQELLFLFDKGDFQSVLQNGKLAINKFPRSEELLNLLAVTYCRVGLFNDGIRLYDEILQFHPESHEVIYNKGNALRDTGQGKEALECFLKVISIQPNHTKALYNIGHLLGGVRRYEKAIEYYEKALETEPDYFDAIFNLANAYKEVGNVFKAIDLYEAAKKLKPLDIRFAIPPAFTCPSVPRDVVEIEYFRSRFIDSCNKLTELDNDTSGSELLSDPRFQLSYTNLSNKEIFENFSRSIRQKFPQINNSGICKPMVSRGAKLKVGFCSNFLAKNHTIEKLYRGIICNLDQKIFDIFVIHHSKENKQIASQAFKSNGLVHLDLQGRFDQKISMVRELDLDALIYTDIGMDGLNYSLSHNRFAPVQLTSWGHPDTSGVDTIDGFISSNLIEPPNACEHYTEDLILFPTLPSYYSLDSEITLNMKRGEFGFSENQNLYGCLQSLFKIHPDFDEILQGISIMDPSAKILFVDSPLANSLIQRWRDQNYNSLVEKAVFLRPMSPQRYVNLINLCDVLLDPLYFGSGNSFYEGAFCGTPQISCPGSFMRGRIVLGGYEQMGLDDPPTVDDRNSYAAAAVDWANCRDRQISFKTKCRDAAFHCLLSDKKVINNYTKLLQEFRETSCDF